MPNLAKQTLEDALYFIENNKYRGPKKNNKVYQRQIANACKLLSFSDNEWYYHHGGMKRRLVRTENKRQDVVKHYHISTDGVHHGYQQTYLLVSRNYYWINMTVDIRNWVDQCDGCVTSNKTKEQHHLEDKYDVEDAPEDDHNPWLEIFMDPKIQYVKTQKLEHIYYTLLHGKPHHCVPKYIQKAMTREAHSYSIKGDKMYLKQGDVKRIVCRTAEERYDAFQDCHIGAINGAKHYGNQRTVNNLVKKYYWINFCEDVSNMIKECDYCANQKIYEMAGANGRLTTNRPWEYVVINLFGKFHKTANNNRYLCVLSDVYSGFTYAQPMESKNMSDICNVVKQFVYLYGPPEKFICDKSTINIKQISESFKNMFGPQHNIHFGHKSSCRYQVPRVGTALLKFCKEKKEWDQCISAVIYAINISRYTTEHTLPYQALFDRVPHAFITDVSEEQELLLKAKRLDEEINFRIGKLARNPEDHLPAQYIDDSDKVNPTDVTDRAVISSSSTHVPVTSACAPTATSTCTPAATNKLAVDDRVVRVQSADVVDGPFTVTELLGDGSYVMLRDEFSAMRGFKSSVSCLKRLEYYVRKTSTKRGYMKKNNTKDNDDDDDSNDDNDVTYNRNSDTQCTHAPAVYSTRSRSNVKRPTCVSCVLHTKLMKRRKSSGLDRATSSVAGSKLLHSTQTHVTDESDVKLENCEQPVGKKSDDCDSVTSEQILNVASDTVQLAKDERSNNSENIGGVVDMPDGAECATSDRVSVECTEVQSSGVIVGALLANSEEQPP